MAVCPHYSLDDSMCNLKETPTWVSGYGSCKVDNPCGIHWYRKGCTHYPKWKPSDSIDIRIKIRTREDIESNLRISKSCLDDLWEAADKAEKYTLATGRGQDERFQTYNTAKSMDETYKKRIKEFENELERYDRIHRFFSSFHLTKIYISSYIQTTFL
jgi:hypothetical protein